MSPPGLATIQSLSTEVLTLALLLALPNEADEASWGLLEDKLHNLTNLALVCQSWRASILSESQFWTTCRVRIGTPRLGGKSRLPVHRIISLLHTFFSRSCGRPLKLGIEGVLSEEGSFPLVQLLASTDRWTSLSFQTSYGGLVAPWIFPLFEFCAQKQTLTGINCFQNVKELSLSCRGTPPSSLSATKLPLAQLFPNLGKLDLQLDFSKVTNLQDLRSQLCLLHLTWLRLRGDQAHLLSELSNTDGLQYFEISEGDEGGESPAFNLNLKYSIGSTPVFSAFRLMSST
ncbi:hypothetical protein BKA70DRAFT_1259237 [Coprinopsis sp. MPI-PUGE-AT-0042]|nr:hypothetical protein BKA70DRAFT_1259237 [Coprinopsis sp. MPI-PUGE-AT-0042]